MVTRSRVREFPKFAIIVCMQRIMENAQRQERKRRVGIVGFGRLGKTTAD